MGLNVIMPLIIFVSDFSISFFSLAFTFFPIALVVFSSIALFVLFALVFRLVR